MKIIVKGTAKEIADLVLQLQDRQEHCSDDYEDNLMKHYLSTSLDLQKIRPSCHRHQSSSGSSESSNL